MRNKLSEAGIMLGLVTLCSLFVCTVCFGQDKPFIDIGESSYSESTVILDESFGPAHGERSTLREIKSVEYLPVQADPVCY
jgi:hypothetical protein